MLRKLYYLLSPSQRLLVRRIVFYPVDLWETLTGKRDSSIPPRSMIYTGAGDFVSAGKVYVSFFLKYGGLQPHHRVLDVGSGIGRMALPLTTYLNEKGSYEGFDVVETGVKWCQKNISAKHPLFRFQHINLRNDLYSSSGHNASTFRFPYPDADFDFVFLTSVFTHMLPDETENYMKEVSRVLKPGGTCLATFFVFDAGKKGSHGNGKFRFEHNMGHYKLMDNKVKSANVAFESSYIEKKLAHENNLKIKHMIHGYWNGGPQSVENDFQDIIVFSKNKQDAE